MALTPRLLNNLLCHTFINLVRFAYLIDLGYTSTSQIASSALLFLQPLKLRNRSIACLQFGYSVLWAREHPRECPSGNLIIHIREPD